MNINFEFRAIGVQTLGFVAAVFFVHLSNVGKAYSTALASLIGFLSVTAMHRSSAWTTVAEKPISRKALINLIRVFMISSYGLVIDLNLPELFPVRIGHA